MGNVDIERLRNTKTLPSLIKFLRDELDWPIEAEEIDELMFEYTPEELGVDAKHAVKIKEIKQLRPLESEQPWGIFWVNFEKKRLPMVVLRRILGKLVIRNRPGVRKADHPSWHLHDLLFISSYGEEEHRTVSFAHFSEDPDTGQLPVLRVLGWDDRRSIMDIDRVANRLDSHLRWPHDAVELDSWRQQWSDAFTDPYREAIRSADVLIPRLARLAANIRGRVRDVLEAETERGPMRRLFAAVREMLIHDMDEDAFADMYAQTVSYGLLSAAFSRQADIHPQNLVQLTAVSNPFLENLLESLFRLNRGKFHFDVDEVGINDVLDLLRNTNIEAIKAAFSDKNPAEDPVIRFYEGFLKEYDPKQRIKRGIFFTPRPVVSYIVRSVHELLQTEFSLEDGLASTVTWGDFVETSSADNVEAASSRLPTRQDAASTSIQYFDPDVPIAHLSGNLPHWRQQGTAYFVTFRLADSMPRDKLRQWLEERDAWLTANPEPHSPDQRREYYERFPARFQAWLDQGYGSCVLSKPDIKVIVESTLRHFAGNRYHLDEFVVMPNHVHVLVTPLGGNLLSEIVHSWKSFTAKEINKRLHRTGRVWQKETFDHIVRSPESMRRIRQYIRDNPKYVETASSRFQTKRQDAASTIQIPAGVAPDEPFVQILDPAVGTGTFLFECIEIIERTMKTKWGRELEKVNAADRASWRDPEILRRWQDYVPKHLLPRLYGYELKMAPYAIAHLKLALKLGETGYQFREGDRLHIYLTNSLEPPSDVADSERADLFAMLAAEAQEVNDIKRSKRFTVVIGNPPYAVQGVNKNAWIDRLMDAYRADVKDEFNIQLLSDDYAKFIRFAHWTISSSTKGLIAMITKNTYLNTTCFRGLRKHLQSDFGEVTVLDLHGRLYGKTTSGTSDTNIFDIRVGVAILFAWQDAKGQNNPCFRHSELFGLGNEKLEALSKTSFATTDWAVLPIDTEHWILQPLARGQVEQEYAQYSPLLDLAISEAGNKEQGRTWGGGVKTNRDFLLVAFTKAELEQRLRLLASPRVHTAEVMDRLGLEDGKYWNTARERRKLASIDWRSRLYPYLYGPFDIRWVAHIPQLIEIGRGGASKYLMRHYQLVRNVGLVLKRRNLDDEYHHAFVTQHTPDINCLSGQTYTIPLRLCQEASELFDSPDGDSSLRSNCSRGRALMANLLGAEAMITERDVFHYIYAILHSPTYCSRYGKELRKDFPRIPPTRHPPLFQELAHLGGELVALHLMESPKLDEPITRWQGTTPSAEVERVCYVEAASSRFPTRQDASSTSRSAQETRQDAASTASTAASTTGTVFIDKARTQGFRNVPENVWNFHIGGYQVCHKWLNDRRKAGRSLSDDDITHYHKIVVALRETIRLMSEIDKAIDKHGGWPIK